jgi:hypothetical protein
VTQAAAGPPPADLHGFTKPVTSFVGGAMETTELATLAGEYRLVTLAGPGGVGKSRLAAVVARPVPRGTDGVIREVTLLM